MGTVVHAKPMGGLRGAGDVGKGKDGRALRAGHDASLPLMASSAGAGACWLGRLRAFGGFSLSRVGTGGFSMIRGSSGVQGEVGVTGKGRRPARMMTCSDAMVTTLF